MDYIFGGDISHWQGTADFAKARANGWQFVYCKASQATWKDDKFASFWTAAKSAGLKRGAYHFMEWTEPEKQAEYFWSVIQADPGELPPVCDFEWFGETPSNAFDVLYRFLERLKALAPGRTLIIYTHANFWKEANNLDPQKRGNSEYWQQYLLWQAHYDDTPPTACGPWGDGWFLWQQTGAGDGHKYGMGSDGVDLDYAKPDLYAQLTGEEVGSMFENNAVSLYIKSDYKVTDWAALAAQVDGFVAIRAGYVPLVKWSDGGYYPNYDTAKSDNDMLKEDPDYRANLAQARAKGLKVLSVFEFNPFYDKNQEWVTSYQAAQIKRILSGMGDAKGDAVCIQVGYYQWIENSKIVTIPGGNFKKAVQNHFLAVYKELGQTIYGWSQKKVLKGDFYVGIEHYDYLTGFQTWLDTANAGEPSYPFGFTYSLGGPTLWRASRNLTVGSPRKAIEMVPALTAAEADQELRIGSYTGWLMKNKANNQFNHGFYALVGCYLPYIKNAAGAAVYLEPIIIDCDKATWFDWMNWNNTPSQDLIPPTAPGIPTATVSGSAATLTWAPATDNVGVTGYSLYLDSTFLRSVTSTSAVVSGLSVGSHVIEVDAFDQGGNHSSRVGVTVTVSQPDPGGEVTREEFDALKARVETVLGKLAMIKTNL